MQVRKLQHYEPPRGLNKGNIAHYSIVQHVTEINVHRLNYFYALRHSYLSLYCYTPSFAFMKIKPLFSVGGGKTRGAPSCCAESELCIDLRYISQHQLLVVGKQE